MTTRRLSPRTAFNLQISMLVFFLAGSSAPTPLYSVYQSEWHFSPITVTVIFGVYAIAVLSSLLVVGSLSDHIGRRPVLLVAIAMQVVAMVIFATAGGVTALLVARVIQGLSTGSAVGALGAGLLDIDAAKGTVANGAGALMGTASGALGSGLLVQFIPAPTHVVYLVLLTVFLLQGVGVALMTETSTLKAGARASLRPQIGLPAAARAPMLVAIPALIAVWSLGGFYASLGPRLIGLVSGSHSFVIGGLTLFTLAGTAALTVFAINNRPPRTVMLFGNAALVAGVGITLLAVSHKSVAGFFLGSAIAGVGFGGGFQGGLRTVLPLAEAHERAGVLSVVYSVSYLALGLPAIVGGFLAVHSGVLTTAREYGLAVMLLAALAFAGTAVRRPASQAQVKADKPRNRDVEARLRAA